MRRFVDDAERRIRLFIDRLASTDAIPAFQPGNPFFVYSALRALGAAAAPGSRRFCEWGSGFGVMTCLARMLGYTATGIEIEPALVAQARQLAADYRLDVEFRLGSYQPVGFADGGPNAPGQKNAPLPAPLDFDLIYVYPWPAEYPYLLRMLHQSAAAGTDVFIFRGGVNFEYWHQP